MKLRFLILITILIMIGACKKNVEPSLPSENEILGFIGCSITHNAIDGYHSLGGNAWDIKNENPDAIYAYGGGCIYHYYTGPKREYYWGVFEDNYNLNPDTKKIWWELCGCTEANDNDINYDNILEILNNIKRIAPDSKIYVSPSPGLGAPLIESPTLTFANKLFAEGKVDGIIILSYLELDELDEYGHHANELGKIKWGEDLLSYFNGR